MNWFVKYVARKVYRIDNDTKFVKLPFSHREIMVYEPSDALYCSSFADALPEAAPVRTKTLTPEKYGFTSRRVGSTRTVRIVKDHTANVVYHTDVMRDNVN